MKESVIEGGFDSLVVRELTGGIYFASPKGIEGEVVNIGSGSGYSIQKVAETVGELVGKELIIRKDRRRVRKRGSEVMRLICDNSRARELLGWRPRYSLRNGLKKTLSFFKRHSGSYKAKIYNV